MPAKSIAPRAKAKPKKAPPKRKSASRPKVVFSVRLNVEDRDRLVAEALAADVSACELAVARLLNNQSIGGLNTSELASKRDILQLDDRMGRLEAALLKVLGLASGR